MGQFTNRDFATEKAGAVLNNVAYDRQLLREAIATGEWEGSTVEVEPAANGYITCMNVSDTGVVKRVTIPEAQGSTNYRFAYMKDADGPAIFGQQIGPLADKNNFLYSDIEIAEQRTARFAERSNRQRRLGYKTLELAGGDSALTQSLVKQSAGRQVNHDHFAAIFRGACDVYLAPQSGTQGLEKDIGGVNTAAGASGATSVAGSQILHENMVMPDSTNGTTIADGAAFKQLKLASGRQAHENAIATSLANLQGVMTNGTAAEKAKAMLSRDSIKGLRYWASKLNIRKLNGNGYDFKLMVDAEVAEGLIGSLTGDEKDTMVAILKIIAQGGKDGDKLLDLRYNNLIIDGVLIQPSRHMQGWRPAAVTAAQGYTVSYNATTATQAAYWLENKKRAYETNSNKVGCAILLGDTSLIHATDGALTITEEKGAHDTGKEWQGQCWRTIKRGFFEGKDAETAGEIRNESSIQLFFGVPANLGAL